jgi:hypothetical protein
MWPLIGLFIGLTAFVTGLETPQLLSLIQVVLS